MAIVEHGSVERIKSKLVVAGVEVKVTTAINYPKEIADEIEPLLAFLVAAHETAERVKFPAAELEQLRMDFMAGKFKIIFPDEQSGAGPAERVDQETGEVVKPNGAESG